MKKRQNEFYKFNQRLKEKQRRGEKYTDCRIPANIMTEVKEHYHTEKWIYLITTRSFLYPNKLKSKMLKDVHYASKRGKKKIIMYHLSEAQELLLKENNVEFNVIKHRIYFV